MVNLIIPVYKARETLPAALDSLVAQTKKMFIVTLSIDGDGENYDDIIKEYRRRGLHLNVINSKENGGPGVARQRGIDANKMCDYLMFLDSDDMLMPRAVEVMYGEAKKTNVDIICSSFICEQSHKPPAYLTSTEAPITWTHNKIYRAGYLKEINLRFPSNLRMNEDSYFNVVAMNCTENKRYIDEFTYIWRDNKNSITREGDFFDKGWENYVVGQIMGMEKITEIKKELNEVLFAQTLCLIYKYVMRAICRGYSTEKIKSFSLALGKNPKIRMCIDKIRFWQEIEKHLKACEIFEDQMIFYDMKFNIWLNQFVLGDK